jgi:hypothetical protein
MAAMTMSWALCASRSTHVIRTERCLLRCAHHVYRVLNRRCFGGLRCAERGISSWNQSNGLLLSCSDIHGICSHLSIPCPASQPPPALGYLSNLLKRPLDAAIRIIMPVTLKLHEEYILKWRPQARSAVDAGQVEVERTETAQGVCQRARNRVRHSERYE